MVDALFVDPDTGIPYTELPVTDAATHTSLGTDGATPPVVAGTGIRGWLRGIYERLGGTLAVNVGNFPASTEIANDVGNPVPVIGPLTDAQLRALAVAISGTVALDAPTLAALETINAIVSGTVAVSNFPSTFGISGNVEVVNDVGNPLPVNGTVDLGAGSLAALETISVANFPVTQPVSIAAEVEVKNDSGNALVVRDLNALIPAAYDFIDLGYTGDDVTSVLYKTGGAGGTTVATLTLAYSAPGVLDTVTRT